MEEALAATSQADRARPRPPQGRGWELPGLERGGPRLRRRQSSVLGLEPGGPAPRLLDAPEQPCRCAHVGDTRREFAWSAVPVSCVTLAAYEPTCTFARGEWAGPVAARGYLLQVPRVGAAGSVPAGPRLCAPSGVLHQRLLALGWALTPFWMFYSLLDILSQCHVCTFFSI